LSFHPRRAETVTALPDARIILCEPFVTPGKATSDNWNVWQGQVQKFQASDAKLGTKYHAPVVKLQKVFTDASQRAPVAYWSGTTFIQPPPAIN
jgi:hypothetical protein